MQPMHTQNPYAHARARRAPPACAHTLAAISRARKEDTHGFPFLISALHPEDEDQSFNSLSDLVREEGDPPCSHPCHARCCTAAAAAVRRSDRKQIPVNFREGLTRPDSEFVLNDVSGCACCGLLLCHSYSDRRQFLLRAACNARAHTHAKSTHAHTHATPAPSII